MIRTTRLKTAMGLALSAFIIQVVGCFWLALNREFTLFTLVAFISLCLSIAAIFHSAKAGKQHGDKASTLPLLSASWDMLLESSFFRSIQTRPLCGWIH
jgi:hypothetical protein